MSYFEDQRKKAQNSDVGKAATAIVKPIVQPLQTAAGQAGGQLSTAAKTAAAQAQAAASATAARAKAAAAAAAKVAAQQQAAVASAGGAFAPAATAAWKAAGGKLDPTGQRPILNGMDDITKWANIQNGGKDPNAALKGMFGGGLANPLGTVAPGSGLANPLGNNAFGGLGGDSGGVRLPFGATLNGQSLTPGGELGKLIDQTGGTLGSGGAYDKTLGAAGKALTNPWNAIAPGMPSQLAVLGGAGKAVGGAIGGPVGDAISGITNKPNSFVNGTNGDGTNAPPANSSGASDFINANMPDYVSTQNPDGSLKSAFSVSPQAATAAHQLGMPATATAGTYNANTLDTKALGVNTQAIDAMRAKGLTVGDTPWAALQKQQNALNETSAKDQAGAQALSGRDSALSNLAMHGGLGGGAAERLDMSASRDMNAARQAATRNRFGADLNTGIADESQKNTLLTNVAGQDLSNAQFGAGLAQFNAGAQNDASKFNIGTGLDTQKFNIGTALDTGKFNAGAQQNADQFNSSQGYDAGKTNAANAIAGTAGQNNYNLGKFQTQITGMGADAVANSIAKGGKK